MGRYQDFDHRLVSWLNHVSNKGRAGVHAPDQFHSLAHYVHEMRLYKSREEIRTMRRAAQIAATAHRRAMEACRPGMFEYQIEAELVHAFMRQGARSPAYPCIVGGGVNSCILHYTENSAALRSGDLLLIDAGAEYDGYASDVSRTFPVNGRFTPEQRAIYEIVLEAQLAAIDAVRPGNSWHQPHDAAVEVITKGLVDVGILKGRWRTMLKDEAYRPYYMHRTSHWLGMDVHDVGEYKVGDEWRTFEPGMVTTVEPGLYLSAAIKGLARRWWNIGIRIEDDVLVTADGHEVLSAGAPKTIEEIESSMGSAVT